MLQIGVHHDDGSAAGRRDARHQRALMTEIAREPHAAHSDVGSAECADHLPCTVDTAVVDDHELPIAVADLRIQHVANARVQNVKIAFLVIRRYHDGNHAVTPGQSRLLLPAMFVPRRAQRRLERSKYRAIVRPWLTLVSRSSTRYPLKNAGS